MNAMQWMAAQIAGMSSPSRQAILYSPAIRELLDVLARQPGLTSPEVAVALGISAHEARNRVHNAQRKGLVVGDDAPRGALKRWRVA